MSLWAHVQSALTVACARRRDEAIGWVRLALEWEPEFGFIVPCLASFMRKRANSGRRFKNWKEPLSRRVPTTLPFLAHGYAVSGRKAEAEKIVGELVSMASQQYMCPFDVAQAFASLGGKDDAFQWMNKAIDDRVDCMIWL